ncbi:MAG: hypothetical protein K2X44_12435, partial [Magnetospirillum sp.]|nr:hypothetical protein [Magnetospirillum sp.]
LPVRQALDLFLARPPDAIDLQQLHHWFQPQSPGRTAAIHARLLQETEPHCLARLIFVASCAPQPLTAEQRDVIARCLVAEDDYQRYCASLYTLSGKDDGLIATVIADHRPLTAPSGSVADRLQAHILVHYGQAMPLAALARRLPLPDLAAAILVRGAQAEEIDTLAQSIHMALLQLMDHVPPNTDQHRPGFILTHTDLGGVTMGYVKPSDAGFAEEKLSEAQERFVTLKTMGQDFYDQIFPIPALRALYHHHPAMVSDWAKMAIGPSPEARRLRKLGSAFFQSLAAALVQDDPALGFQLRLALRERGCSLHITIAEAATDWLTCLPFEAPDSPEAEAARAHMLDQAITDGEFLEIATAACGCGCRDWLMESIHAHLAMAPLWRRGKGLALAAQADLDDAEFDALVAKAQVDDSWVGDTLPALRTMHDRNVWARHWYGRFLTADSDDAAYGAFVLFLRCADRRCRLWMTALEDAAGNHPQWGDWRVRYRLTNEQTIANAITENEKTLEGSLIGLAFNKAEAIPYGLWL